MSHAENQSGKSMDHPTNNGSDHLDTETVRDGRVLVLYTGGTIGMIRNEDGVLEPKQNAFVTQLRKYPHMYDRKYAEKRFGSTGPLVLPLTTTDNRRVIYSVLEYSPLCDSSDMTMNDWIRIANDIKQSYEHFDGFVVLHGTDTLSYTASALSFMLKSLGKTVILTGSQVPIFDTRSDGLDNFLSSLIIAGNYNIPEVCVYFGTNLMRGNRTSKMSSTSFEAFDSPNFPPLAKANVKIEVNYRAIFRSGKLAEKFHVHTTLNRNVGLLRIFPSITTELVKAFLRSPIEGVVIQSYGVGNLPTNREDIINELRAATKRGIIIVNITQCSTGCVSTSYKSGKLLEEAGVLSGFDMTPEAALTKLAYVLSKEEWDTWMKRKIMQTNIRGELTGGQPSFLEDLQLMEEVAKSLNFSLSTEVQELGSIFFPAMLNAAAQSCNIPKLKALMEYGVNISQQNADGRTALHIACCEGHVNVVLCLVQMGADIQIEDRYNRTPLMDAITFDHHEIIKILIKCGAYLHEKAEVIARTMCTAAAVGNVKHLESHRLANADLSQADFSGRTPLHFAALFNKVEVFKYLLNHDVDTKRIDKMGQSPYDLAKAAGSTEIVKLLSSLNPSSTSITTNSRE